jgi:hypothetical protein
MGETVDKFNTGPAGAVNKLNKIIEVINSLKTITGDGIIKVNKTSAGITIGISIERLRERFPIAGGSSGSGVAVQWVEIIEMPSYDVPGTAGRAYYTCRLVSSEYETWDDATAYVIGKYALYSGKLYIAKRNNLNCRPDVSPDDWEEPEEIRVEYAIGCENITGFDIRDCVPWVEVGEIVPVISKVVESATRYYIWLPSLMYAGDREHATLRYNPDDKITQAVFK